MPRWNSFAAFLATAQAQDPAARPALVNELLAERPVWPWVTETQATFIYNQPAEHSVALNLDTIKSDPPFAPLQRLDGTDLWHVTHEFAEDDLLDYLLAIDDPGTPLAQESDVMLRITRHWRADALNPLRMTTAGQDVSVLRMPEARPYADWPLMQNIPQGNVQEYTLNSQQLQYQGRKLWVYTPPDYDALPGALPLLILQDGQWMNGPLQVPAIANALIKHRRMRPIIIAMVQSSYPQDRTREYVSNDRHYLSLLLEVVPFLQNHYRVEALQMGVGGVSAGAIAAAHAALKNPAVFTSLIMVSPPLGKGEAGELLSQYPTRFSQAPLLPARIFQSVGRYEGKARFIKPAQGLRDILSSKNNTQYRFVETGSGHGLVSFRSVLPEALAWAFPPEDSANG